MTFARDPGEEEREEQDRLKEVGWFYRSVLVLAAVALLMYWVATGRPWWRDLSVGEAGALHWGRLAARALSVPLPSLIGAFIISDARTWWAPLAYIVYLLAFTALLWIGTGSSYLRV